MRPLRQRNRAASPVELAPCALTSARTLRCAPLTQLRLSSHALAKPAYPSPTGGEGIPLSRTAR
jgi:hypothetical protein